MLARFISSSSAAVIVTSILLIFMASLITRDHRLISDPPIYAAPVLRFEAPPPEVVRREPPERPREVEPPPPRTRLERTAGETIFISGPGDEIAPPTGPLELTLGIADGDLMAIVTVAPTYPPAAERRGLEGYVIVEFRVTANGAVDNVRVTESSHAAFEHAAVQAAGKFRFRPRVVNGVPVAVDGVKRRITFTLRD